jgi:uncharacterized membrane protein YphA (DoxX/SURF4 family)
MGIENVGLTWLIDRSTDAGPIAIGVPVAAWILGGAIIGAGFLTTAVVAIVAVVETALAVTRGLGTPVEAGAIAEIALRMLEAACAGSLALTGPGAYSVDARLFGRREIIIPPAAATVNSLSRATSAKH